MELELEVRCVCGNKEKILLEEKDIVKWVCSICYHELTVSRGV